MIIYINFKRSICCLKSCVQSSLEPCAAPLLTFKCVDLKCLSVTIQMKATEQYFPVVLFSMLYKVVLTFESVDDSLKV